MEGKFTVLMALLSLLACTWGQKAGCRIYGKQYKSGERFISPDCRGQCKCIGDNAVACVSLCPPVQVRCKSDERVEYYPEPVARSSCFCQRPRCKRKSFHNFCVVGDKAYKLGGFITEDCTSRCVCRSGGSFSCVSLCPPNRVRCGPGQKQVTEYRAVGGSSKCKCPVQECIAASDDFCTIDGERHKVGTEFINKDCTGRCVCRSSSSFGCVSLCPPHQVRCPLGSRRRVVYNPVVSSKCRCRSYECV